MCRAKIEPEAEKNSSHEKKEDCDHDVASISGSCKHYTHNGTPIACLAGQFDAAGHTETDDD